MKFFNQLNLKAKKIFVGLKKLTSSEHGKLAVKNSYYTSLTSITSEVTAVFFTIILARILMPELFGLYNLALSTILIFTTFSILGTSETTIKFLSQEIGKGNKGKPESFIRHLSRIKIIITFLVVIILLFSANFISHNLYNKPINLALLAGIAYIIFVSIFNFFLSIFYALNEVKIVFYKEIIFQVSRIVLVLVGVLFTIKNYSNDKVLFVIFISLALAYLISDVYMFSILKKYFFHKNRKKELKLNEKKRINNFLFITSTIFLSGIFFSYIDKILLGHFVAAEFIGYYSAAFGIVSSVAGIVSFGSAFLPIFTKMTKKTLNRVIGKTIKIASLMSIFLFIIILLLSGLIIKILYGSAYLPTIGILELLSPLIIFLPLTSIYLSYFLSREKPKIIAILLIISTIVNILLGYILASNLLKYGDLAVVYGISISAIVSQVIYLFGLYYNVKSDKVTK